MYRLVGAWCLRSKLIAGEIQDLKALCVVFLIELLQFFILRCESAFSGGIDNEKHFVGILLQRYFLSFSVLYREIINSSHFLSFSVFMCFNLYMRYKIR